MHSFSKRSISFTNRIPIDIYQFALSSIGEVRRSLVYLFTDLLFIAYIRQRRITHLFIMTIFKFNYKILLRCHSLYNTHHLFPRPPSSSLPFLLLHISYLCLHGRPHPDLRLDTILLLDLRHSCDTR